MLPTESTFRINSSQEDAIHLLRGLSAQVVLFGHAISIYDVLPSLRPPVLPFMQNMGVIIFFFISGLVITESVLRKSSDSSFGLNEYLIERLTRIHTALIPALIFIAILDFMVFDQDFYSQKLRNDYDFTTFIANIFCLQNYYQFNYFGLHIAPFEDIHQFGSARPLWSVAVEVWVYVFFGFVFFAWSQRKYTTAGTVLLVFAAPIVFQQTIAGPGNGLAIIWALGSLACWLLRVRFLSLMTLSQSLVVLLVIVIVMAFTKWRMISGPHGYSFYSNFVIVIGCFVFVLAYERIVQRHGLEQFRRFGRFIASYSYSLYLLHYSLLIAMLYFRDWLGHPLLLLVVAFVVCNVVAWCFYLIVESRYHDVRATILEWFGLTGQH